MDPKIVEWALNYQGAKIVPSFSDEEQPGLNRDRASIDESESFTKFMADIKAGKHLLEL